MAAPQFDSASLQAIAKLSLEPQTTMLCEAVAKHVKENTPITCFADFWKAVAETVKAQDPLGAELNPNKLEKDYRKVRKWAVQTY